MERASPDTPDARHLLLVFLERHAPMIMQIAPDVDGESLRRTVENEIATQDTQCAK